MIEHTTGGNMSLAELADQHRTQPSSILRLQITAYSLYVTTYLEPGRRWWYRHRQWQRTACPLPSC